MKTEIGEYIVGAYLQCILECDVVQYNMRLPGGKLAGLAEMDVIGINFKAKTAHLCEVTTHITGMLYGKKGETLQKVIRKFEAQKNYAAKRLEDFTPRYSLWSPVVTPQTLKELQTVEGLELRVNGAYKKAVEELRGVAKKQTCDLGNPFMRTLQILERLRDN